jgi:hypothetical protein
MSKIWKYGTLIFATFSTSLWFSNFCPRVILFGFCQKRDCHEVIFWYLLIFFNSYIAQTNPDNFFAQRLHHFSDEVFILLDLTLSKHFLKHFGGLFTENFYGLIRKDTSPQRYFWRILMPKGETSLKSKWRKYRISSYSFLPWKVSSPWIVSSREETIQVFIT